jgi:hypothetical protein
MSDLRQAELERVAAEWLHHRFGTAEHCEELATLLKSTEAAVMEDFKKRNDACGDFRHCECASSFWHEWIGKPWMDNKIAEEERRP